MSEHICTDPHCPIRGITSATCTRCGYGITNWVPAAPAPEYGRGEPDASASVLTRLRAGASGGEVESWQDLGADAADEIDRLSRELAAARDTIKYLELFDHDAPVREERDLRYAVQAELARARALATRMHGYYVKDMREVEADRADAARYRFLRDHPTFHYGVTILVAADQTRRTGDVTGDGELIDAHIDAAIAASTKGRG